MKYKSAKTELKSKICWPIDQRPGRFEWWTNWRSKISLDCPFKSDGGRPAPLTRWPCPRRARPRCSPRRGPRQWHHKIKFRCTIWLRGRKFTTWIQNFAIVEQKPQLWISNFRFLNNFCKIFFENKLCTKTLCQVQALLLTNCPSPF